MKNLPNRQAAIERQTTETDIALTLNIDGTGEVAVSTGYGFADHMLTLFSFWADFDLSLTCKGDLHVDAHHTLEDVGFCLGQALHSALGEKKGIARTAHAQVPMDEALASVTIDLSGRSYLVFQGQDFLPPTIAGEENDLWREFFRAFSYGAKMNLHISIMYGRNGHHILESACKGLGLALRSAVCLNRSNLLSTKGSFD